MTRTATTPRLAYVIAVILTVLALLITLGIPALRSQESLLPFLVAITLSAWYGGLGPGLLASLLSYGVGTYFVLSPRGTFFPNEDDTARVVFFLVIAFLVSYLNQAWINAQNAERQARERAEATSQRLIRLQALTSALSQALTPHGVADIVLREGLAIVGAQSGSVTRLTDTGDTIELLGMIEASTPGNAPPNYWPLASPSGLSEAIRTRVPVFIKSQADWEARYPELARTFPSQRYASRASLPLILDERILGAMGFGYTTPRSFDDTEVASLQTLAQQCAQALERARLFEVERRISQEAQVAAGRAAFLAEATEVLSSTLDVQDILSRVVHLTVPRIADWCVLNLVRVETYIEAVEIGHVDPHKAEILKEFIERFPLNPDEVTGTAQVIRSGQSELYTHITDYDWVADDKRLEQHRYFQAVGYESVVIVPLVVRDIVLGAMTLVRAGSGRFFDRADQVMLDELARRVATALDNARLYEAAQAATQARERLLYIVSHDLKNPLTVIRGYLHVLRRRVERTPGLEAGPFDEAISKIEDATTRMNGMIQELVLTASQSADQVSTLDRQPTDLGQLVRQVVSQHQAATTRHQLQVDSLDSIVGQFDAGRLSRVLDNLLANAIKYSPEGGVIRVQVSQVQREHGPWAELTIQDNGVGIPKADLPHIFEPFHRAANVRDRLEGSGLGLASVRQIIEAHGGTITVSSQEGNGSTFRITLPLSLPILKSHEIDDEIRYTSRHV